MDKENVVGLVYRIKCEMYMASYIGKMERSLKARFSEQRRQSSSNSDAKQIHLEQPDHTVKMDDTKILITEFRWFKRGSKEANYIKTIHPSPNRDEDRYSLLSVG